MGTHRDGFEIAEATHGFIEEHENDPDLCGAITIVCFGSGNRITVKSQVLNMDRGQVAELLERLKQSLLV